MILLSGGKLRESQNIITEQDIKEKFRFLQSGLFPVTVAWGHSNWPILVLKTKLHDSHCAFTALFEFTSLLNIPCTVWFSFAVSYH